MDKAYFSLSMESLRKLADWAADCAERSLGIFERVCADDPRPRAAIEGAREFARSGKRTARLRKESMDAYRASRQTADPAASAAAEAACLAASAAYTHPLADAMQARHILGPAAYAALAIELSGGGAEGLGDGEIARAAESADGEIVELLLRMPRQGRAARRAERLMILLDEGLRARQG